MSGDSVEPREVHPVAGALPLIDEATPTREGAFEAFVASHRARAVRLAWRLLGGDLDAAEDVAQDAFEKAYRALGRFRGEAALGTWFYRILVRQASRHRRWRGVRERFRAQARPESRTWATRDPGLRRRIGAALERLTGAQREAFVLVHLEGFTVRETAELLGKSPGTVKSHLHRALASLRRDLADLRDPPGRMES